VLVEVRVPPPANDVTARVMEPLRQFGRDAAGREWCRPA
jgi:hypothetical protein